MDVAMSAAGGDPNISLSVLVMNQSDNRSPPYSPLATATMAIGITSMMLFTIFGNILVIIAVLTSRSLRGPQNLFLVSLAAADILVATLIIPFSLANELMGYWYFRTVWCEIYLALDVFFCTSSIAHLCAISLDRYLSVSRPVAYTARRTAGRVKAAIVVVWLIAAVISFPPLLSIEKNQDEDGGPQCKLNSDRWYILYSTIGSFFAPCLIMILVYVRIYQIAKRHTRCPPGEPRRDVSGSTTTSPQRGATGGGGGGEGGGLQYNGQVGVDPREDSIKTEGDGEAVVTRPPTLDVGPSSSQCSAQGDTSAPAPAPGADASTQVSEQPTPPLNAHAPPLSSGATSSNPPQQQPEVTPPKPQRAGDRSSGGRKKQVEDYNDDDSSSPESDNDTPENHGTNGTTAGCSGPRALAQKCRGLVVTTKGTQLAKVAVKTSGTPNTARRKALVNREKRFTFVLAVVIGVFVLCWFPFFFSYSLKAICPKTCALPEPLFNFFFWIGYCNSSLNPLIYTIFNKDFRKAFKKILCKDAKNSAF